MSSVAPFNIRVTISEDKTPRFDVMHNGEKIATLSFVELVEVTTHFASSLRWQAGTK